MINSEFCNDRVISQLIGAASYATQIRDSAGRQWLAPADGRPAQPVNGARRALLAWHGTTPAWHETAAPRLAAGTGWFRRAPGSGRCRVRCTRSARAAAAAGP